MTVETGVFRIRLEICNPMLRRFMSLPEGQEIHYDVQVGECMGEMVVAMAHVSGQEVHSKGHCHNCCTCAPIDRSLITILPPSNS